MCNRSILRDFLVLVREKASLLDFSCKESYKEFTSSIDIACKILNTESEIDSIESECVFSS